MPAWKKTFQEVVSGRDYVEQQGSLQKRWYMGGVVWVQGEGTADGIGSHMQSGLKHHFRVDLSNFIFYYLQFNPLELCCPIW